MAARQDFVDSPPTEPTFNKRVTAIWPRFASPTRVITWRCADNPNSVYGINLSSNLRYYVGPGSNSDSIFRRLVLSHHRPKVPPTILLAIILR